MALIGHMGNPSLSVTWSLAVEEQFYIVLPIVAIVLRPNKLAIALAVGALAAIVSPFVACRLGLPLCIASMPIGLDRNWRFGGLSGGRCCRSV